MRQPGDFVMARAMDSGETICYPVLRCFFEGGVRVKRLLWLLLALMLIPCASTLGEEDDGTMEFKSLLRGRILENLNAWPAK